MKVDGEIGGDPTERGGQVRRAEEAGYDGVWSAETSHDPFLPLLLAAEHTDGSSSAPASRWRSPATR